MGSGINCLCVTRLVREQIESVLENSWNGLGVLARSWGGLGRPWGHLARTREGVEISGVVLSRFLDRLGGPKGRPDDPKTTP